MSPQTKEWLLSEKELVLLLNQGDEPAFEQLYHLYSVRILKKLIALLKDEEIAKEVLQDIFITLWEKRRHIDAERSLRSYLFRIAENRIVDVFRKASRDRKLRERLVSLSLTPSSQTEEIVLFKESSTILQQAINTLPPQRKKIFILCRVEGKTYEEAGTMMGISPGTVNDHMVKAMRAIKARLTAADLVVLLVLALLN